MFQIKQKWQFKQTFGCKELDTTERLNWTELNWISMHTLTAHRNQRDAGLRGCPWPLVQEAARSPSFLLCQWLTHMHTCIAPSRWPLQGQTYNGHIYRQRWSPPWAFGWKSTWSSKCHDYTWVSFSKWVHHIYNKYIIIEGAMCPVYYTESLM